jgi:hypothetical protein
MHSSLCANHPCKYTKKDKVMTIPQATQLNPVAQDALRLIRALRRLPETSGTIAAEKRTLNQLRLPDLCAVSLILRRDDEAEEQAYRG